MSAETHDSLHLGPCNFIGCPKNPDSTFEQIMEFSKGNTDSPTVVFDQTNDNWSRNPCYNMLFLRQNERYFNALLCKRGHVFLNEIYDGIGVKRTPDGQRLGWLFVPDCKGFITFGVEWNAELDPCPDPIHMTFNIDGEIWEKI